jgi:hypothetical protein
MADHHDLKSQALARVRTLHCLISSSLWSILMIVGKRQNDQIKSPGELYYPPKLGCTGKVPCTGRTQILVTPLCHFAYSRCESR